MDEKCSNNRREMDQKERSKKCKVIAIVVLILLLISAIAVPFYVLFDRVLQLESEIPEVKTNKDYVLSTTHKKEHVRVRDEEQMLKMNLSDIKSIHVSDVSSLDKQRSKDLLQRNATFQNISKKMQVFQNDVNAMKTDLSNKIIKLGYDQESLNTSLHVIKETHRDDIACIKETYDLNISRIVSQHRSDVSNIKNTHYSDVSRLEQSHAVGVSQINEQIRNIEQRVQNAEGKTNSHRGEISALKDKVARLEWQLNNVLNTIAKSSTNSGRVVQYNVWILVASLVLVLMINKNRQ